MHRINNIPVTYQPHVTTWQTWEPIAEGDEPKIDFMRVQRVIDQQCMIQQSVQKGTIQQNMTEAYKEQEKTLRQHPTIEIPNEENKETYKFSNHLLQHSMLHSMEQPMQHQLIQNQHIRHQQMNQMSQHTKKGIEQNWMIQEEIQPTLIDIQPKYGYTHEHNVVHIRTEAFPMITLKYEHAWIAIITTSEGNLKQIPISSNQIENGMVAFQLGRFESPTRLKIQFHVAANPMLASNVIIFNIHSNIQNSPKKQTQNTMDANNFLDKMDDEESDEEGLYELHEDIKEMDNLIASFNPTPTRWNAFKRQSHLTKINFRFEAERLEESLLKEVSHMGKEKKGNVAKKVALLLSVTNYSTMVQLKTPEFDSLLMESRLLDQGYETIRLTNEGVNKQAIAHAFYNASQNASGGDDQLVIHFAGHGLPGRLCLSHYHPRIKETYLQLAELLSMLPSTFQHVLVVLDCCHSGTTVSAHMQSTPPSSPVFHSTSQNIHIVTSTLSDIAIEDDYNGLFTAALCRALRRSIATPYVDFASLFDEIVADMTPFNQRPNLFQLCGKKPFMVSANR